MMFDVDRPIVFEKGKCVLCGKEDDDWFIMQLLSDGAWRTFPRGTSLRSQGLDEIDASHHVYCVHSCSEKIMRTFTTDREVNAFHMALRERGG
jgi:hypothetical protein